MTIQQQEGIPTLSADLNERAMAGNSNHRYQFKSKNARLKRMNDCSQVQTVLEARGGGGGGARTFSLQQESEGILRLDMRERVIS